MENQTNRGKQCQISMNEQDYYEADFKKDKRLTIAASVAVPRSTPSLFFDHSFLTTSDIRGLTPLSFS